MTIKAQNGKVVTKDGKVSCECCDVECCLYPAQTLADGEYSANDLPDAVTFDGTSFSRSGTSYGNTTNGVILEENVWAKYRNAARSTRACLIQGGVEDQFADTYTVTSCSEPSAIGTILTRTSLCYWEGQYNTPFAGTQTVSIFYCPSVGTTPSDVCNDTFKFYSFYSRDVGGLTDPIIAEKTPHSNTPSGNYTAENGSISFA
jgi:hypothetical protein